MAITVLAESKVLYAWPSVKTLLSYISIILSTSDWGSSVPSAPFLSKSSLIADLTSCLEALYSSDNTIGTYLNNTYFKTIEESKNIVNSSWYIGSSSISNLSYTAKYNTKVSAKIGMLSLGDLFVGDVKNVLTISRGIGSSTIINVINEEGSVFGDFVTSKYNVRPSFYLKSDMVVKSGKGTESEPYVLGVANETEEK